MNAAAREEKRGGKRVPQEAWMAGWRAVPRGGRTRVELPGQPWVAFPRLSPPQVHIETETSGGTRDRDPAWKRPFQTAGLGEPL